MLDTPGHSRLGRIGPRMAGSDADLPSIVYPIGSADAMLAASAISHPSKDAITLNDRTMSFGLLDTMVSRCAAMLRDRLDRPGTVVAVTSVLSPDFIIGYYGAMRSGNVAATLNPFLREEQLGHLLAESEAELALVDAATAARIDTLLDRLPRLRGIILLGPRPADGPADRPTLREVLADVEAGPEQRSPAKASDLACLHFTSGTTGTPKTVMLSHRNVAINAAQIADAQRLSGSSVVLNHLPTYHPMHLNSAILVGATQVLCAAPDSVDAIEMANRHGASHFYSLPPRLLALANSDRLPQLRLETVGVIASGGSALPPTAARKLADHFDIPVVQGYGLAETAPLTHSDGPTDWVAGTVGKPVADTECRIVEVRTRAVLAAGASGEIQLRGPQVMLGYAGDVAPTAIDADGWLSTGDIGQIRPDGRLVLIDRLKDVFKRDNWLVAPSEVEAALRRHPQVRECVVVEYPDPEAGSVATAFVVLEPDAGTPDLDVLRGQVNDTMPYYQHLEHLALVDQIPRSPNGKVPRVQLRAQMAELLRPRPS